MVDGDDAVTFFEDYAGHCGLTTAYCINVFHSCDYFILLISMTLGS